MSYYFHGQTAKNSIKSVSRDSSTSDCSHDHKIKSSYLFISSSPCKRDPFSPSQMPVSSFSSNSDDADHPNKVFVDDDETLFGAVPSPTEIQTALTSLKQVFGSCSPVQHVKNTYHYQLDREVDHVKDTPLVDQVDSDLSEADWKEPSFSSYNPSMLQADVFDRASFAVHLLQTDACVERMVRSLSSDKSVWNAVQKNQAVQELRNALNAERDESSDGTVDNDSPDTKKFILRMSDAVIAKLMEAIENITEIVKKLFQTARHKRAAYAGKSNSFKMKLRVSFMLSIMIFLFVVVGRFY
ncbi:uncharacterized protein LOC106776072 [Vigna radiata var. radiata]|uniref:Uncharacterized protein LOC106776072 n=1 Tax=Vigna radiata var. radiata TaxID=3916 RepID=A0A1S3VKI2_VIGRR|nr:uncharacterized protein LOC106776072 [Vigna radiata var. radiata]